ncbi:MAG: CHASE domain-containing protein [Spirochaetales bacterium]|nr:CHASE domain-containing protein [Spirochaetales bacterium]
MSVVASFPIAGPPPKIRYMLRSLAIAAAYTIAGLLAIPLAIPPGFATAVWPAAGIATGCLAIFGRSHWPGVFVGSLAVNTLAAVWRGNPAALESAALLSAAAIGLGAALQAIAGAWLLERFRLYPNPLTDERRILLLMLLVGPVACLTAASVGTATLAFGARFFIADAPMQWLTWWVGDTIGALIFVPMTLVLLAPPQSDLAGRRRSVALPLLVAFGFAVVIFLFASQAESRRIETEFRARADSVSAALQRNLDRYVYALDSVHSLYRASNDVTRSEFSLFTQRLVKQHTAIAALEWVPRVPHAMRATLETQARREGLAGFRFQELGPQGDLRVAGQRKEYFPVYFIEPGEQNAAAFGLDLASNPVRARALLHARLTRRPVATAPLNLVQSSGGSVGFLLLYPIFKGSPPELQGYVAGVFQVEAIVEETFRAGFPLETELRLSDATDARSRALYSSPQTRMATGSQRLVRDYAVHIGGRVWQARIWPSEKFMEAQRSFYSWLVLAGGLLLTVLLAFLLLVISARTARVEEMVARRTESLHRSNEQLSQEMQRRRKAMHDLEKARGEAIEASRAKSDFLARMSHEIRTPLNAIVGAAELLSGELSPPDRQKYVRMLSRAGDHLLHLINDVLEISRIEAGRVTLEDERFHLGDLVQELDVLYSVSAAKSGLSFVVKTEENLPEEVLGDPYRLRQVLVNLLSNALKFTAQGSVELEVGVSAKDEETIMVRFVVSDSGIGVPPEKREAIFDHFTQADMSVTRQYGGTGLGLSICRALVEMMGGRIFVSDRPGQPGARFEFTVKLRAAPALPEQIEPGREQAGPGPDVRALRILLVDDAEDNRTLALAFLARTKHQVEVAHNGAMAFQMAKDNNYDLILMDMHMPVMDGFEAVRRIREYEQEKGSHRTPIVALTAYALQNEVRRCMEAGCDLHLAKPIRRADLLRSIGEAARLTQN